MRSQFVLQFLTVCSVPLQFIVLMTKLIRPGRDVQRDRQTDTQRGANKATVFIVGFCLSCS